MERSNPSCIFKFVKLVSRVCAKCGWEIPADAPEGGCPGCLLESGLRLLDEEAVAGVGLSAVAAYSAEAAAKAGSAKGDDPGHRINQHVRLGGAST